MKTLQRFSPLLLTALVLLFFSTSCKKRISEDKNVEIVKVTSPEMLTNVKAFQEEEMKKGIMVFSRQYNEGEIVGRVQSIGAKALASCIGDLQLELSSAYAEYRNSSCGSAGNYYMYFNFTLTHSGITLLNANTLPIRITYTINGVTYTKALTIASFNTTTSGTKTNIVTNPVIVNEYCLINTFALETDPQVSCPDGQTYSGTISVTANILADRSDPCKNVAVAFVQPNLGGNGTVGLNGYFLCNNQFDPCFAYAQQVEFQYRKVGNKAWATALLSPYLGNAMIVNNLQPGTYEFQWRNKKVTSPSCSGPFSTIITRVIN